MLALLLLLATALIRPEGWFLLPAALMFWVWRLRVSLTSRVAALAAVIAVCVALAAAVVPRLSGNLNAVGPVEMLRSGQTIWEFDGWRVPMPADAVLEDGTRTGRDAVVYALHHPLATASLMTARIGVHFVHARPYYSMSHNLLVVVWLMPVYLLAIAGLWATRSSALTRWICIAIAAQLVVVALTHADWDGRYLSHMMPLIYAFAACAAAPMAARVSGRTELVA